MTNTTPDTMTEELDSTPVERIARLRFPNGLRDDISVLRSSADGAVTITILMGVAPEGDAEYPTEGFAEITLSAEVWKHLAGLQ